MYTMQNIPEDIVQHIMEFLFAKCNHCSMLYHYSELIKNFTLFKYKSVFDDDYGMGHFIIYEYICNDCKWKLGHFMI